jgi:hypothetical protein
MHTDTPASVRCGGTRLRARYRQRDDWNGTMANEATSETTDTTVHVRFPPDLKAVLLRRAAREHRTLSQEIRHIVCERLETGEKRI